MSKQIKLNDDDRFVMRVNSLALFLLNKTTAASTIEIKSHFYSDLTQDTFTRQFQRDRATLKTLGIVLNKITKTDTDYDWWEIDREQSFSDNNLSKTTKILIKELCKPMVNKESFHHSNDLLFALNKIGCASIGATSNNVEDSTLQTKFLEFITSGFIEKKCCVFKYRTAQGNERDYIGNIFGFFTLNGSHYMVIQLTEKENKPIYTLRVDRIINADFTGEENSYLIPKDFKIEDYIKLPFQFGVDTIKATFYIPDESYSDFITDSMNIGELYTQNNKIYWSVDIKNIKLAISWAVSHGITPVEPKEITSEYLSTLKG